MIRSRWKNRRAAGEQEILETGELPFDDLEGRSASIKFPRQDFDQYMKMLVDANKGWDVGGDDEKWKQLSDLREFLVDFAAEQIMPDEAQRDAAETLHGTIRTHLEYLGYDGMGMNDQGPKQDDPKLKSVAFKFFEDQGIKDMSAHQGADLMMNMVQVFIDEWGWSKEDAKQKLQEWFVEWAGGGPENLHLNNVRERWMSRRGASDGWSIDPQKFLDMELGIDKHFENPDPIDISKFVVPPPVEGNPSPDFKRGYEAAYYGTMLASKIGISSFIRNPESEKQAAKLFKEEFESQIAGEEKSLEELKAEFDEWSAPMEFDPYMWALSKDKDEFRKGYIEGTKASLVIRADMEGDRKLKQEEKRDIRGEERQPFRSWEYGDDVGDDYFLSLLGYITIGGEVKVVTDEYDLHHGGGKDPKMTVPDGAMEFHLEPYTHTTDDLDIPKGFDGATALMIRSDDSKINRLQWEAIEEMVGQYDIKSLHTYESGWNVNLLTVPGDTAQQKLGNWIAFNEEEDEDDGSVLSVSTDIKEQAPAAEPVHRPETPSEVIGMTPEEVEQKRNELLDAFNSGQITKDEMEAEIRQLGSVRSRFTERRAGEFVIAHAIPLVGPGISLKEDGTFGGFLRVIGHKIANFAKSVFGGKKKERNAEYEEETRKINENKKKPEAKKRHKFKRAEFLYPNMHPRCLTCGDEESTSGYCNDTKEVIAAGSDPLVNMLSKVIVESEGIEQSELIKKISAAIANPPNVTQDMAEVAVGNALMNMYAAFRAYEDDNGMIVFSTDMEMVANQIMWQISGDDTIKDIERLVEKLKSEYPEHWLDENTVLTGVNYLMEDVHRLRYDRSGGFEVTPYGEGGHDPVRSPRPAEDVIGDIKTETTDELMDRFNAGEITRTELKQRMQQLKHESRRRIRLVI